MELPFSTGFQDGPVELNGGFRFRVGDERPF